MLKRAPWLVSLSLFVAACGGDPFVLPVGGGGGSGAGGSGSSSGSGSGSTSSGGPDPASSFSVTFGPQSVPPGTERTQCVVKRLGNPQALHVGSIHNVLNGLSHHLIVYRVADTVEQTTPFDCQPFTDTLDPAKGSPLMVTQKHDDLLELPPGVGFTLEANQMVRLEMHYLNTSFDTLDVTATSTFIPIADADFKDEAGFLFIGNPDISIPANSAATLGPTFIVLPPLVDGANFFGVTGHTHQWGKNVTVAVTDGQPANDKMIYDVPGWTWSEPATVYLDPPVTLPKGGGFRFTCSWENKSANTVSFGESAQDEMCFFWAYYYPSKGSYVCAHTDQVAGGYDLCCPGNPFCGMLAP